jgi:predicted amino acid-binding ACT domain protein
MNAKWLLVVTGKDRPGIIAGATGVLYAAKANLEDISMTILEGVFAMIVVVAVQPSQKAAVDRALGR